MIIYLICFTISVLFTYIAENNFKKNNKILGVIFSIIAILVPSFLAGVRSSNVGIDVEVYVNDIFDKAREANNLTTFLDISHVEQGYSVLAYLVSRATSDVHWMYFISELIICFFVYYSLYKERKNVSIWLGMLTFFFTFYNITLNLARQSIAVALILFSIITLKEKKYVKTVIMFLLSLSFHNSAILAIPMYIIILIGKGKMNIKKKNALYGLICIVIVMSVFFYEDIINYLTFNLKILSTKYTYYLTSSKYNLETADISYFSLLSKIFWIILYVLYANINKRKDTKETILDNKAYSIFLLIDFLIVIVSFKITNIFRVGHYYQIPALILLTSNFRKVFKNDKLNQIMGTGIIILALAVFWYYSEMLYRGSGTNPYMSDVFGLLNF